MTVAANGQADEWRRPTRLPWEGRRLTPATRRWLWNQAGRADGTRLQQPWLSRHRLASVRPVNPHHAVPSGPEVWE